MLKLTKVLETCFLLLTLSAVLYATPLHAEPQPGVTSYWGTPIPAQPSAPSSGKASETAMQATVKNTYSGAQAAAATSVNTQNNGLTGRQSEYITRRQAAYSADEQAANSNRDARMQVAVDFSGKSAPFTETPINMLGAISAANVTTQMPHIVQKTVAKFLGKLSTCQGACSGTPETILNYLNAGLQAGCFTQEQTESVKRLAQKNGMRAIAGSPDPRVAGSFTNPDKLKENGCIHVDGKDMTCLLAGVAYRAAGAPDIEQNGSNAAEDAGILFRNLSRAGDIQSRIMCVINKYMDSFCVKKADSGDQKIYDYLDKLAKKKGDPLVCRKGEESYAPSRACLAQLQKLATEVAAEGGAGERGVTPAMLQQYLATLNNAAATYTANANKSANECPSDPGGSAAAMTSWINSPSYKKWFAQNDFGRVFERSYTYVAQVQEEMKVEYASIVKEYIGSPTMYAEEQPKTPALADVMKQSGINSATLMPIYPDVAQQMAVKEQPRYVPQATLISTNGISAQQ